MANLGVVAGPDGLRLRADILQRLDKTWSMFGEGWGALSDSGLDYGAMFGLRGKW